MSDTVARAPFPRLHLALIAAVLLFPLLAYFGTAASIVAIWDRSGTFAHGYVILPIVLWLIWQRRSVLRSMPVQPYFPALLALFACGFAWLLAQLGEVQTVRQYAFAAMLPLSALAILGLPMARAMAFPLAFILFAVPFGDIFINPLIGVTANFTVEALTMVGVPVFREGNNFTLPSGSWSVVEACSGVRYLISSVTLGCLYAYLTYRSLWRRALFIGLSIIVPIIANGLRAFMIVMMGHLSGMTMAVGFDHLVYGWLFFGLVMFLLFWIGSFWREDGETPEETVAAGAPAGSRAPIGRMFVAACAVVAVVGIWPAYLVYLERSAPTPVPVHLAALTNTTPAAPIADSWHPEFPEASAQLLQYVQQDAAPVGLALRYYRNPAEGIKLISSSNRVLGVKDLFWRETGASVRTETINGKNLAVRETTLSDSRGRLLVWHWYWIDGHPTSNDYMGKALQVEQKFLHGTDDGALVMVFSPYEENPEGARTALRSFLQKQLGAIDAMLAANKRH